MYISWREQGFVLTGSPSDSQPWSKLAIGVMNIHKSLGTKTTIIRLVETGYLLTMWANRLIFRENQIRSSSQLGG